MIDFDLSGVSPFTTSLHYVAVLIIFQNTSVTSLRSVSLAWRQPLVFSFLFFGAAVESKDMFLQI